MRGSPAIVLTDRMVANAVAAAGKRLELWDSRCPGLCLRVTPGGAKTWVFRYRSLSGGQPRFTLGSAGGAAGDLCVEDARDKASLVKRQVREGFDPALEKRRREVVEHASSIRTIDELAAAYFNACETGTYRARRKPKKPATLRAERSLYKARVKPYFGAFGMRDLTKSDIRPILQAIALEAPYQSNAARAMLRAMYNYAMYEDLIDKNPIHGLLAVGVENPRDRVLSDDEIRKLWRALEDPAGLTVRERGKERPVWVGEGARIALRLSVLTLQRRGEIAGMLRSELRLDEGTWVIGKERAKNGKAHVVPLSPMAVELIRKALALHPQGQECEAVFPTRWDKLALGPIEGAALTHALGDIYSAIGITDANLHDLRRTGATAMASERLKVPPVVISRILNHQLDGGGGAMITFRHYAIYDYAQEKRDALVSWSKLVGSIVRGSRGPSLAKRPDAPRRKVPLRAHVTRTGGGGAIRKNAPAGRNARN